MTYRERLRLEGASLAISGAAGAVLLLVLEHDAATSGLTSTVVQVAIVAALMATVGLRSVRRAMAAAVAGAMASEAPGSGQPTALWLHPLIVAGLTLPFGLAGAWDAGLRVCGGCAVVGLAQIAFSFLVAREEARRGLRFYRVPGSSLFTGTKLGTCR